VLNNCRFSKSLISSFFGCGTLILYERIGVHISTQYDFYFGAWHFAWRYFSHLSSCTAAKGIKIFIALLISYILVVVVVEGRLDIFLY